MEELPDFTVKTQTVPLKQIQAQLLLCKITFSPHIRSLWTSEYPFNGSAPQSIQGTSSDLNKCENVYLKFDVF